MKILKYLITIIINYSIVLISWICYPGGAPLIDPIFIMMQILFAFLNHKVATNKISLLFLDINLLVSTIIANKLSTILYYNNISSDSETLAVGSFELMVGVIFVSVISLISILLKRKKSQ